MQTEQLKREHLPAVAALEKLCFAEPWSERALEWLLSNEAVGVVALTENNVIGYGGMLIAPKEGQITNVAVHPDCRRLGGGRAIVSALLREAANRRLESVSLEVRQSNLPAIALYERLGFEKVGVRKHFYKHPAEDALVMTRVLAEVPKED